MNNRDFLMWIHERLEHIHKENPMYDYMRRLRSIILNADINQKSGMDFSTDDSEELRKKLKI